MNITETNPLDIKCVSTQYFPNGSVIFESFDRNVFTMETENNSNDEPIENGINITGLVIVSIIALLIILTIALIFYAQSKQIFCYESEETSRSPPVVFVIANQEDNASIPVTTELFIEETNQHPDNQEGQPQNESIAGQQQRDESFEPPTVDEMADIDDDDDESPEKQGFLKQNDSQRLLELINSPPPFLPHSGL